MEVLTIDMVIKKLEYVKDIAKIFFELINKNVSKQVLNISTNYAITINELFKNISKISNKTII